MKVRDPYMPDTPEQAREYLKKPGLSKIHSAAHLRRIRKLAKQDQAPEPVCSDCEQSGSKCGCEPSGSFVL